MNVDEAGTIYDAMTLSNFNVDRYLIKNPVYFWKFAGGQNALATYILDVYFKLLPFNPINLSNINLGLFIIILPFVFINLISYFCLYKLLRTKFSKNHSLFGTLLAMILPFSIMHSRWILESYLLFPTFIISTHLLLTAINKRNKALYFVSGLSFGLVLYTYAISYIIVVLTLSIIGINLISKRKISATELICFLVPLIFLGLPLLLQLLMNAGLIKIDRINYFGFTIAKFPYFRIGEISLSNIIKNLFNLNYYKSFLYDGLTYNSYPLISTIYYLNIPLLIYGLFKTCKKIFKNNSLDIDFIIITITFSTILTSLLIEGNNVNKLNLVYFPIIYFIFIGYINLFSKSFKGFSITLVLLALSFSFFCLRYYTDHSYKQTFEYDLIQAIREIQYIDPDLSKDTYIDIELDYNIVEPYIYFQIYNNMNPYNYIDEKTAYSKRMIIDRSNFHLTSISDDLIKEDSIYLTYYDSSAWKKLTQNGYSSIEFGNLSVIYTK